MSGRSRFTREDLGHVLPDVPVVEMIYQRRQKAERAALREEFNDGVRQSFLRHLAMEKDGDLRERGFKNRNIESMLRGRVPPGYNVHHIKPLDDGGDNSFGNLVLMRAHPDHEAVHRYLDPQLVGLQNGQSRTVQIPLVKPGIEIPLTKDNQMNHAKAARMSRLAGQEI